MSNGSAACPVWLKRSKRITRVTEATWVNLTLNRAMKILALRDNAKLRSSCFIAIPFSQISSSIVRVHTRVLADARFYCQDPLPSHARREIISPSLTSLQPLQSVERSGRADRRCCPLVRACGSGESLNVLPVVQVDAALQRVVAADEEVVHGNQRCLIRDGQDKLFHHAVPQRLQIPRRHVLIELCRRMCSVPPQVVCTGPVE